jgi:hypothetical protein
MPPAGFEPTIPASERPQTHTLDWAATAIVEFGEFLFINPLFVTICPETFSNLCVDSGLENKIKIRNSKYVKNIMSNTTHKINSSRNILYEYKFIEKYWRMSMIKILLT